MSIPYDYRDSSIIGAFVSIISMVIICWLLVSEILVYCRDDIKTNMFVDQAKDLDKTHATIRINMDIIVPKIPCAIVSVDAQDVMGSHIIDISGNLHKIRLDPQGTVVKGSLENPSEIAHGAPTPDYDPMEQKGEGCHLQGYITVKKVPGNFHISAHSHTDLIGAFFGEDSMNVSHYINHLWFGKSEELKDVQGAIINPLEGVKRVTNDDALSYEYFIKIVPSTYENNGITHDSYQFVANSHQMVGRYRLPAIYFRYDLSPMTVKFSNKKVPLSHFIVQICAIVGGIFTVFGWFRSVLQSSANAMKKRLGKHH